MNDRIPVSLKYMNILNNCRQISINTVLLHNYYQTRVGLNRANIGIFDICSISFTHAFSFETNFQMNSFTVKNKGIQIITTKIKLTATF